MRTDDYVEALGVAMDLERCATISRRQLFCLSAVLAEIYTQMDDPGSAVRQFRKAIETAPRSGLLSRGLCSCLVLTGEYDDAVAEFRRFIRIGARAEIGEWYPGMANVLWDLGLIAKSELVEVERAADESTHEPS